MFQRPYGPLEAWNVLRFFWRNHKPLEKRIFLRILEGKMRYFLEESWTPRTVEILEFWEESWSSSKWIV